MSNSEDSLKDYVVYLLESHVRDIESLTVWEMSDSFFSEPPTEEDFDRVFELLSNAEVGLWVKWDGQTH